MVVFPSCHYFPNPPIGTVSSAQHNTAQLLLSSSLDLRPRRFGLSIEAAWTLMTVPVIINLFCKKVFNNYNLLVEYHNNEA